jgi:hypothetical protein
MGEQPDGTLRPGDKADRALTLLADRADVGGAGRRGTAALPRSKPVPSMVMEAEVPYRLPNPNAPLSTATSGLGGPGFGLGLGGGRGRGGDIPPAMGGLGLGIGAGLLGQR